MSSSEQTKVVAPPEPASSDQIFLAIRQSLDGIPAGNRGSEWLRASIVVNCLFRQAAEETFLQLQELRSQSGSSGFPFDEFVKKVFGLMDPYTLGPHGYKRSLGSRASRKNWRVLSTTGALLEELGYQWFVNSGTLLGLVRDHDFIAHDDDADLAIILPGDDLEAVMIEWVILREKLEERGMVGALGKIIHHKLQVIEGLSIDLFPCWIFEDRVHIFPHTGGEIRESDLLPLRKISIGGVDINVPAMPEKILELNYGPDWRVPNPAWKFDWVGARGKFGGLRSAYERAKRKRSAVPE